MKAVKKIFNNGVCSDFILVGGEVETIKNGERAKFIGSDGKTLPKAEIVHYSLVNHYRVPGKSLTMLQSDSNTLGNAKEVARYFREKNIKKFEKIGILTSFYHLPRAMKIFKEAGLALIPICAESIVYDEEFDLIKDYYKKEGFSRILASTRNVNSEIKGMGDQEKGSYISKFK